MENGRNDADDDEPEEFLQPSVLPFFVGHQDAVGHSLVEQHPLVYAQHRILEPAP